MKHIDSLQFSQHLSHLLDSVGKLMVASGNSQTDTTREDERMPFDIASDFSRPSEYLQCMLDVIRTIYEPDIIGTLFLNSNPAFFLESIPENRFHLGYLSQVKSADITFEDFWYSTILTRLAECGYNLQTTDSMFLCLTTGSHNALLASIDDVSTVLNANFSLAQTQSLLKSTFNDTPLLQIESVAGYCVDEALESKMRLSLWLFSQSGPHPI